MATLSPALKQSSSVVVDHAKGSWIYAQDGRRYLDFTTGIGVTSTGHCHPRVVKAAQEQIGKVIHAQATTVMHQPMLDFIDELGTVLPEQLNSIFFSNSGSEAVESALRLAKMATGRQNIIAFQGGFHGRTMGAASVTSATLTVRSGFGPMMPGVFFAPYPNPYHYHWSEEETVEFCLRELDFMFHTQTDPKDTAAFIIEPVQGDGGYIKTPPVFMKALRDIADRYGIMLICDEVQAGVGKTGHFWSHQISGITPDIMTMAKGIASGFPISGIAANESIMKLAWPGSQGGTYCGNAVSAAAGVETIRVIKEEHLVANAAERGEQLGGLLHPLAQRYANIGEERGVGLMRSMEFIGDDGGPDPQLARKVQLAAEDEGLLTLTCSPYNNVVRIVPALNVSAEEIDEGASLLTAAVESVLG
jgi:4-aminobutyrate aminotransferase